MNIRVRLLGHLLLFVICLFSVSCKLKTTSTIASTDNEGYDKGNLNNNYNWTGTYELKDNNIIYSLRLHKRSVDGSYELQFYNNSKNEALYKSSIYDAKDDSTNIYIKFLNNFNMDAKPLGFKSGDTLFILQHLNGKDISVFKSFKPTSENLNWNKISNGFN